MVLNSIIKKIQDYGILVMFSHTIFSLSFAFVSMLAASNGLLEARLFFWILVCFMAARTGANAINRVIDSKFDALNPRTNGRQIPQGTMDPREVVVFSSICFVILLIGAYQINWICFILSPIALFLLATYSYTKRFTYLCHLYLGLTSACAPVGAWLAVTGRISLIPIILGLANMLWVAGFDIIYGAQDVEFDRNNGLNSIPAKFGVKRGLEISRAFHFTTLILLSIIGSLINDFGIIYFIGIGVIAMLFFQEYRMVSPNNLKNVNIASYSINQLVSLALLVFASIDIYL
ncbi:4-hydroxybenzoate octaprenyltransferase [Alkalibacter mobilis]|uniref:4-hydroxybenzoate octaprenyltransferase n=1 Tax=Alkalibacter mobilis TaxID=2787712 RepID=UPI00189C7066|nr:4-hydroxybenzoate octaprenyltransferase [Alkalibacter mobilis]MBF7095663.1 4-hydroxybenzoate octaprenyltransferase [Alkalibacter mobilis]